MNQTPSNALKFSLPPSAEPEPEPEHVFSTSLLFPNETNLLDVYEHLPEPLLCFAVSFYRFAPSESYALCLWLKAENPAAFLCFPAEALYFNELKLS